MEKVKCRTSNSRIFLFGIAFLFMFSLPSFAQEEGEATVVAGTAAATEEVEQATVPDGADAAKGKTLFNSLCAACHKRYKKAVGPALYGVTERRETEWLYKWIKNSAALIASGDAQAVAIWEEYNKTAMNAFPQLSNGDIDNILAYVMEPPGEPKAAAGTEVAGGQAAGSGGVSNLVVLGVLGLVFLMLVIVLFVVLNTLKRFAEVNGIPIIEREQRTPIWKAFIENQFLVFVSVVLLLLTSAYFVYGGLMQVGVDQGYMPIQPIHYSHKIHAGTNQIECKYCHSSARVSKHSGIPSLNVCMNCHKSIQEYNGEVTPEYSKEFYDGEIAKLYKAVGWDVEKQGYTGKTEPVKWVRIHNLPDFAYFNHSQHVSVAGIACQKCHGPVEEMEIMYQYSSLTMGWCINCHRETNIVTEGNEYYEQIHEKLSKKYGVDKLTAAQMGGLECGKCHY